jgi:hypothetical protein
VIVNRWDLVINNIATVVDPATTTRHSRCRYSAGPAQRGTSANTPSVAPTRINTMTTHVHPQLSGIEAQLSISVWIGLQALSHHLFRSFEGILNIFVKVAQ